MKTIAIAAGVLCAVAGGVLLATGNGGAVAVVLLVIGLAGLAFSVGGSAGAASGD